MRPEHSAAACRDLIGIERSSAASVGTRSPIEHEQLRTTAHQAIRASPYPAPNGQLRLFASQQPQPARTRSRLRADHDHSGPEIDRAGDVRHADAATSTALLISPVAAELHPPLSGSCERRSTPTKREAPSAYQATTATAPVRQPTTKTKDGPAADRAREARTRTGSEASCCCCRAIIRPGARRERRSGPRRTRDMKSTT
jgi:hypothetical protein